MAGTWDTRDTRTRRLTTIVRVLGAGYPSPGGWLAISIVISATPVAQGSLSLALPPLFSPLSHTIPRGAQGGSTGPGRQVQRGEDEGPRTGTRAHPLWAHFLQGLWTAGSGSPRSPEVLQEARAHSLPRGTFLSSFCAHVHVWACGGTPGVLANPVWDQQCLYRSALESGHLLPKVTSAPAL